MLSETEKLGYIFFEHCRSRNCIKMKFTRYCDVDEEIVLSRVAVDRVGGDAPHQGSEAGEGIIDREVELTTDELPGPCVLPLVRRFRIGVGVAVHVVSDGVLDFHRDDVQVLRVPWVEMTALSIPLP